MHKYKSVMGFDFGTRSIGVAIGQLVTLTARPLEAVSCFEGMPNWRRIEELQKNWSPELLLVGLPLALDGKELWITKHAKNFAKELYLRTNTPVELVNESLTTTTAKEYLFNKEGYKGLKKGRIDAISAAVIIEHWLNQYAIKNRS